MFRMRYPKQGKTGKTPPMLFPNHLIRLVDYFAQTSKSYFKTQNTACAGQDPVFQKRDRRSHLCEEYIHSERLEGTMFFQFRYKLFLG